MKKLLALPLLLLSTSAVAAKDIEVLTDIGEKYIIKMSAVKTTLVTSNSLILAKYQGRINTLESGAKRIESRMEQSTSDHQKCIDSQAFSKDDCDYTQSNDFLTDEQDRLDYVRGNITKVKEEMANEIRQSKAIISGVLVRYRSIFEDLNGIKKGLGYNKIICLIFKSKNNQEVLSSFPDYKLAAPSDIALEQAEYELCEKLTKSL